MSWQWLENPAQPARWPVIFRIALKALALFALVNIAFAALDPMDVIGRVSIYNVLVPGRERLLDSYSNNLALTYQSAVTHVPALIASSKAAAPKSADEFRVLVLGDSGTRGFRLSHEQSLATYYNQLNLKTPDGRSIVMYNLAHPITSLFKDFLLLEESARQNLQPDLVIWLMTLRSALPQRQYDVAFLRDNAALARQTAAHYGLDIPLENFAVPALWDRTLIAQRRTLANILRLQTYGFAWAATRYDGDNQPTYTLHTQAADEDSAANAPQAENIPAARYALDIVDAAYTLLDGTVPLVIINQPIHRVDASDEARMLNAFYRRDLYAHYQQVMQQHADAQGWHYVDLWDAVPPEYFTNTPLHYDGEGARILAERLASIIPQVIAEETP